MSDDQINAAISQLYGWSANYCNDLNAMHEAEEVLGSEALFEAYYLKLYDVTHSTLWPIRATARQRAEAFLRAMGKWEEVQP